MDRALLYRIAKAVCQCVVFDHVGWESVLTRLPLCLTGMIFEVVKKMVGFMFFRGDFPKI